MLKKLIYIITVILTAVSCMDIGTINPYAEDLHTISISLSLPEGVDAKAASGVKITVSDVANGNPFETVTDASGKASITLPNGLYRVAVSLSANDELYSASEDRIRLSGSDREISLKLVKVKTGDIVIKEIYCGGCKKLPQEGEYQSDKYIILHNNSDKVMHLDSLCFGMISPPNATAANPWIKKDPATGSNIYPEFVPVFEAVWQFGGSGNDFPLKPGEDAVIAICGAIDHAAQYPLSVNLNHEDYFVCYNTTYFPNTYYHPAPGDKIRQERILNVVIKTGQSNAFPFSVSSPGVVIFKAKGITMHEFIGKEGSLTQIPGTSGGSRAVCIPFDWVEDAVEVFDGRSSNNTKRFVPQLDGGYIYQRTTYQGHTLMRRTNENKSQAVGYEVLVDTNNSSNDFYERDTQSLHAAGEGGSDE